MHNQFDYPLMFSCIFFRNANVQERNEGTPVKPQVQEYKIAPLRLN